MAVLGVTGLLKGFLIFDSVFELLKEPAADVLIASLLLKPGALSLIPDGRVIFGDELKEMPEVDRACFARIFGVEGEVSDARLGILIGVFEGNALGPTFLLIVIFFLNFPAADKADNVPVFLIVNLIAFGAGLPMDRAGFPIDRAGFPIDRVGFPIDRGAMF